jgi:uncharacterized protein (DUF4415 family)
MSTWFLIVKPKGKGLRGKPKRRHEDNIKIYFKLDAEVLYWMRVTQDGYKRLGEILKKDPIPLGS